MQLFFTILTVVLATYYLGNSFYKKFNNKNKNCKCGDCSTTKNSNQ